MTEINKQITKIETIIKQLEETLTQKNTYKYNIHTYGIINYTRTQYLPQTSNILSKNEYSDIFYNYTSAESMSLDLLMIIESDLIKTLNDDEDYNSKIIKLTTFTIKVLKIIEALMITKDKNLGKQEKDRQNQEYTNKIQELQNIFYTLVYDEKIDSRVK